jgi:hypothetical protein
MDGVEAVRRAVHHARSWYQGTIADVTAAQAVTVPPGVVHPIGELAAHIVQSEDGIVNGMLQGKPTVWEQGGWSAKLGGMPNLMRHDTATARSVKADPQSLQEYTQAVYASVDAYLDGLTPADLDREVQVGPAGTMAVADVLTNILAGNTLAHTGEISALKGLQGAKGYPF